MPTAQFLHQLHRRARQAHSPLERHQAAFYLWEFGLRMLGCVAVIEYASANGRDRRLELPLRNLARPMLGQWWELVRVIVPLLAERGDPEFQKIHALLSGRARDNLWDVIKLDVALKKTLANKDDVGSQQTVRIRELFDRMIQYRNNEWHGFLGGRDVAFYEDMSSVILAGVWELWQAIDVLAGRRLVFVEDVRRLSSGQHRIVRWDLCGEQAEAMPPLDLVSKSTDALPLPGRLYLIEPGDAEKTTNGDYVAQGNWRMLYPLAIYESAQQELFLYGKADRRRGQVGYVGCISGEHPQDVNVTDRRELLRQLLGHDVNDDEVVRWTEQSRDADKEDDRIDLGLGDRRTIGEFQLISRLGNGAFGTVYRAWQPAMRREVAIKRLTNPGRKEQRERFSREVQALGRVDHPHLVKVFYSGTDGEDLFYAMELIEGADLARVLEGLSGREPSKVDSDVWHAIVSKACESARNDEAPLSDGGEFSAASRMIFPSRGRGSGNPKKFGDGHVRHAVELVRDVADALQRLHDCDVLHRDIKPGNIMVTPDGEAVLMDLGLAQLGDADTLTQSRQFVGTIRYSSPEQAFNARSVDARSDIYSLGATFWELLTLKPFLGISADVPTDEQFARIRRQEPESARKSNPLVPPDLARIVTKCVEKDETRRYRSMADLVDDLNRWLRGEAVLAFDPSLGYLLRKSLRKHRKAVFGLTSVAVALIAVTIGTIAFLDNSRRTAQRLAADLQSTNTQLEQTLNQKDRLASELVGRNTELTREAAKFLIEKGIQEYDSGLIQHGSTQLVKAWRLLDPADPLRQSAGTLAYDRLTRQRQSVVYLMDQGTISDAAFSKDGRHVFTASSEGLLRRWDAVTGAPMGAPMSHASPVVAMAIAPAGREIATVTSDSVVHFWNVATGQQAGALPRFASEIKCIEFSPDGKLIAVGTLDGIVTLVDSTTRTTVDNSIRQSGSIWSLCFSADGKRIATGSRNKHAQVWDAATRLPIGPRLVHVKPVSAVSFSPDGSRLATATFELVVRFWDLATFELDGDPLTHDGAVRSIAFSPDGQSLATASVDHFARIWDVKSRKMTCEKMPHDFAIVSIKFSPDGTRVVTGSTDKTARIWPVVSAVSVLGPIFHQRDPIPLLAVAYSPDGSRLVTASGDRTARIWDAQTGLPLGAVMRHRAKVSSVDVSHDGTRLATGSEDRTAQVWDTDGSPIGEPLKHDAPVNGVALSADGTRLATTTSDNKVFVWDTASGHPIGSPMQHGTTNRIISSIDFSPDSTRIVTGSADKTARIWDAVRGERIGVLLQHRSFVTSVRFSPDGTRVATSSMDGSARIWDGNSGQPLGQLLQHDARVESVAFSPDGTKLVTGSREATFIWDVLSEKRIGEPIRQPGIVNAVSFSPDGNKIVTASDAGIARVWDVSFPVPSDETLEQFFRYQAPWNFDETTLAATDPDAVDKARSLAMSDVNWRDAVNRQRRRWTESVLVSSAQRAETEGRISDATQAWQYLVDVSEGDDRYRQQLAHAFANQADWPRAIELFDNLSTTPLNSISLRYDLAIARLASGDVVGFQADAASILRDVLQDNGVDDWFKAITLATLHEQDEATRAMTLELAQRLADSDPDSAKYRFALGAALFQSGQFERAADTLRRRSSDTQRDDLFHCAFLVLSYQALGQLENAKVARKTMDQVQNAATPSIPWQVRVRRQRLIEMADASELVQP